MGGCQGPITTFIVEPFIPHKEEFYLNIVSERLGSSISFSECGGIEIEENWDKVSLSGEPILFGLLIESLLQELNSISSLLSCSLNHDLHDAGQNYFCSDRCIFHFRSMCSSHCYPAVGGKPA